MEMVIKDKPMAEYAKELMKRLTDLREGLEMEADGLEDFLDATEEDEKHIENWYVLDHLDGMLTAVENAIEDSI